MGTNRDRTREPHTRGQWCPACDRAIVRPGQRCPRCGVRLLPIRNKKPGPQDDWEYFVRFVPCDSVGGGDD